LGVVSVDGFRFRHPLIRSAVYRDAGSEERRRAHAALADVLADDPDRAVWHRAAATTEPDENVASALAAAAERARLRGGGDVAMAALERGANLTPDPRIRALRLWRAAHVGWQLGRWQDSGRLFREAQRLGLPPLENAVASFSLEAFEGTMSSSISTVRAFTRVAGDLLAAGEGRKALEALESVSVRAYWGNLDHDTRRDASAVARKIDVPSDDPRRLCFLALVDPIRNGREVIEQLRQISPMSIGDSSELLSVGMAAAAVWADDSAVPLLRAAAKGLRAEGRFAFLAATLAFEAWANLHRGALRPAITAAAEAARMAEEAGQALYVPAAKLALAVAMSQRGDDDAAQDLIAEAEAVLLQLGATPLLAMVALARSRTDLAAGRFADAYQHVARLFDPADVAFQPFLRGAALADLVDAAIGGDGDLDLVGRHLAEWQQIAFETKAPYLEVQLSYTAAVLAEDDAAEHLLQDAMTSGAAGWEFYAARARLAYGGWLRRHSRSGDARATLREAARTFDALGQEMFAERALTELRASGETARRRAKEPWAQLTPQELQIAQLAADGLSNREIGERLYLSHRTVGTHLYDLFPKLGITSRAQLRDVLEPASSS
jgi:DNA-binding CsgD family transcriptional regulator